MSQIENASNIPHDPPKCLPMLSFWGTRNSIHVLNFLICRRTLLSAQSKVRSKLLGYFFLCGGKSKFEIFYYNPKPIKNLILTMSLNTRRYGKKERGAGGRCASSFFQERGEKIQIFLFSPNFSSNLWSWVVCCVQSSWNLDEKFTRSETTIWIMDIKFLAWE